jgi:hypothetical protein
VCKNTPIACPQTITCGRAELLTKKLSFPPPERTEKKEESGKRLKHKVKVKKNKIAFALLFRLLPSLAENK